MRFLCALAFVIALSGCAGDAATRATASVAVTCGLIADSIKVLTPQIRMRTLPVAAERRIVQLATLAQPLCASDSRVDPAGIVAEVEAIAAELQSFRDRH